MTRKIGKKEFMVLGKLLVKNRPEIAEELLPAIGHPDNETNRTLIPLYYQLFCKIRSSDITDPSCRFNNRQKTKERKIFIAVILRLYANEVFYHSPGTALFPFRIGSHLTSLLHSSRSAISQLIRQVLYDHRNYEQFRTEVDQIVSSIKSQYHGQAETIKN